MTRTHDAGETEASRQLGALALNLSARGFAANLTRAGRHTAIHVASRSVPQLTETVYAAPADGVWWFWWSWADRIAPVGDVEAAAFKIAYVLTPDDGPG